MQMFMIGAETAHLNIGDSIFFLVSFIVLLWLVKKFAFGPVSKMMDDRANKISADLDYADDARQKAAKLEQQRQEELNHSKVDANQIIATAKQTGEQSRQELLRTAADDAAKVKAAAQADIEQSRADALESAKSDVAKISIEIASKIIQKDLTASDQTALIDSYIEGLGKSDETR